MDGIGHMSHRAMPEGPGLGEGGEGGRVLAGVLLGVAVGGGGVLGDTDAPLAASSRLNSSDSYSSGDTTIWVSSL